jgi:small nuclear ribonucleoprotein (snRNP)-like protein
MELSPMEAPDLTPFLESLLGKVVVVDLMSTYVCLGTLVGCDAQFLELRDADLHDFRDSSATREVYVHDSVRLGIRRNRSRVLIRRDDVVALTRFDDIATF